jgi:hypothetical protein
MLVSCLAYSYILKMKVICSSETSVDSQRTTRQHIPEDRTFHLYYSFNLTPKKKVLLRKMYWLWWIHTESQAWNWFIQAEISEIRSFRSRNCVCELNISNISFCKVQCVPNTRKLSNAAGRISIYSTLSLVVPASCSQSVTEEIKKVHVGVTFLRAQFNTLSFSL